MNDTGAPRWAVPALAALLVAKSDRHYLRRLDPSSFASVAKACDRFLIWTTSALFALAAALVPWQAAAAVMVIGASVWGMAVLVVVGRRVAIERQRRQRLHD